MKILYFLNDIQSVGGINTITKSKIDWFLENTEISIILLLKKHPKSFEFFHEGRLKIYSFGSNYTGLNFLRKIRYALSFSKFVKSILRKENPQICISVLTSIDFFVLPIIVRKPLLLELHSSAKVIIQASFQFKRIFYKLYSKVVVLNELEKESYDLENVIVIPNFIKIENNEEKKIKKKKIIISGGRKDPIKQFEHQIEIWNKIFHLIPDWEYHIYINANESELEKYRSLVSKDSHSLKIKPSNKDFRNKLEQASIFVLTSKYESFSLVILEAFQAQNAIVSYATFSGPLSLITNNFNGVLVKEGNMEKMGEQILNLALDEKRRDALVKNASKEVLKYDTEIVMQQWLKLFDELQS